MQLQLAVAIWAWWICSCYHSGHQMGTFYVFIKTPPAAFDLWLLRSSGSCFQCHMLCNWSEPKQNKTKTRFRFYWPFARPHSLLFLLKKEAHIKSLAAFYGCLLTICCRSSIVTLILGQKPAAALCGLDQISKLAEQDCVRKTHVGAISVRFLAKYELPVIIEGRTCGLLTKLPHVHKSPINPSCIIMMMTTFFWTCTLALLLEVLLICKFD